MTEKMHRTMIGAAKAAAVSLILAAPSGVMASKPPPAPPPPPPPPPIPTPVMVNNQFFDWFTDRPPMPLTPPPNYIDSPRLTNANAAAVNTFLTTLGSGAIRAVKVESPITTSNANLIFNNPSYNVSYIFGDIETGLNTPTDLGNLVKQVRWVNGTVGGTAARSSKGYVGGFGFDSVTPNPDPTSPVGYTDKTKHSFAGWTYADYCNSGANMSNSDLYPGSPSFRNKASGDSNAAIQSPPNIRTSLFMMPLKRIGLATSGLIANGLYGVHKQIPYVANFNNWGNLGLDNDRGGANGYLFTPGAPMLASGTYPSMTATQTQHQNLSSQDFAALIGHIRLRGADSFHTLESGQIGISNATMLTQASEGWMLSQNSNGALSGAINTRMSASDKRLLIGFEQVYGTNANDNTTITVDGVTKNAEQTGAIMDGVYSLSQKKLDFLISNMDDAPHKITLPSTIAGYSLNTKDYTLTAGTHLLVEYSLVSGKWTNAITGTPFTDLDTNRDRPGVPEPGMLSLLGVAGVFGMTRRRRRAAATAEL